MDASELKQHIRANLHERIIHGTEDYDEKVFTGMVPNSSKIREYLHHTRHYSPVRKRWMLIPEKPKSQLALREAIISVMQDILIYFKIPNRRVIINRARRNGIFLLDPDVVIAGCGTPSFKGRSFPTTPNYDSCVCPIFMRREGDVESGLLPTQLGIYAYQCLATQHHRRFVYSLWFTEFEIKIYQFDRTGCICSNIIDLHKDAELVVRLILGVASPDDAAIGFDTTIRWKGRHRYIRTLSLEQQPVEYEVDQNAELIHFPCLAGNGTTCWPVTHDGNEYMIKDWWKTEKDSREEEFLVAARGLNGVVQLVSYEVGVSTTDLRWVQKIVDRVPPRQFFRLTTERYGDTIDQFGSRLQLLHAFRDAVQGHQTLLKSGILHRDISCENIVLGKEGCNVGNRGIIIDFGRAIWSEIPRNWDNQWPSGLCTFQSIVILSGFNGRHSFLDDLESFFYVLLCICICYEEAHQAKDEIPSVIQAWYQPSMTDCALAKTHQLKSFDDHFPQHISSYFGPIFIDLLKDLLAIFWTGVLPSDRAQRRKFLDESRTHLLADPDAIYKSYLSAIDRTIQCLEQVDTLLSTPEDVKPTLPKRNSKRRRSSDEEDSRGTPTSTTPERKKVKTEEDGTISEKKTRTRTRRRRTK